MEGVSNHLAFIVFYHFPPHRHIKLRYKEVIKTTVFNPPHSSLYTLSLSLQWMPATLLLFKRFYWQGDLDLSLKAWEKHTSLAWILESHFALLDTTGTQTLISKLKLAAENKGAITVTLWPLHLPFCRNTSQFHLERSSHKIWAPSSPRTTGQYVGRHSHRREAPVPQEPITIPSENSEFWRDGVLEGSWLSSKLLLHFYIKSQLECQMSFQPSPDTERQCAEKNKRRRGGERDCNGVTTGEKKKKAKKKIKLASTFFFLPAHWHTPPSPINGTVQKSYPSGHSLVKAFCPGPLLWQVGNSMLFYT